MSQDYELIASEERNGNTQILERSTTNSDLLRCTVEYPKIDMLLSIELNMDSKERTYELIEGTATLTGIEARDKMTKRAGMGAVTKMEEQLKQVSTGIRSEQCRSRGVPIAQADILPGAVGEMLDQMNAMADPLKYEKVAGELWQSDWPQQDKSEWNTPQKPAHDGPAPTITEMLEQKDDTVRFYEQQHTGGERARLFAFNAETGESLTWEWDAQTQQPLIEDPQNMLDSLKQKGHWQGMETMINDKASKLSGDAPEQDAPSFADRISKEDKGAQRGI